MLLGVATACREGMPRPSSAAGQTFADMFTAGEEVLMGAGNEQHSFDDGGVNSLSPAGFAGCPASFSVALMFVPMIGVCPRFVAGPANARHHGPRELARTGIHLYSAVRRRLISLLRDRAAVGAHGGHLA